MHLWREDSKYYGGQKVESTHQLEGAVPRSAYYPPPASNAHKGNYMKLQRLKLPVMKKMIRKNGKPDMRFKANRLNRIIDEVSGINPVLLNAHK